jgi:probable phosphoglycerate mutase
VGRFCHFGLESVLLSHVFNCSPMFLFHPTVARTSSVTTLYTEERRKGKAIFRCCGFGDIGHLYAGGEEPSFAARFCEVYGNGDRQD